jgi:putative glutamine amidotransferase
MRSSRVRGLRYDGVVAAEAVLESIASAGGDPVVMHALPVGRMLDRARRFDGLVIPGGADIDPVNYDASLRHEKTEPADMFQDASDIALARSAMFLGIPLLGICRGMQVVNVAGGGSLIQHLGGNSVDHHVRHAVTLDPLSATAEIVGSSDIEVSSYHHQAVADLAPGFRAAAWAPDGVVEAIESSQYDVLCVQWHPEDDASTSTSDHALFGWLVSRARQYASRRDGDEGAA